MEKHIRISWDDEAKTILRRDADYGWTWAELAAANAEMAKLLDSVEHEVCTLVVQNYSKPYIPANPLANLGAMLKDKHPRVGLSIVVSHSSLVRSIIGLLIKLSPSANHLRFVNSLEEGRMQIRQYFAEKIS